MIYKFTYMFKNNLIRELYTNDVKAMLRFNWLVENNISFKIITTTSRRNKYYG